MKTEDAFAALRAAGLMHDDTDIVRMFDTNDPDFVVRAKAAKPNLFRVSAHDLSAADYKAALKKMTRTTRTPVITPAPGFNALTASPAEYAEECRRMKYRISVLEAESSRFRR